MTSTTARRPALTRRLALALGGVLAAGAVLAAPALAGGLDDAEPAGETARTRAISGFDNSVSMGPGASAVTMSLDLPAGRYLVNAKVGARLAGGATEETVTCRLVVPGGLDKSDLTVSQVLNLQTMALQVAADLASPQAIEVSCDKSKDASTIELTFVKVTALKVHSMSVVPLDVD